jgi:hypothetical protein
MTWIAPEYIQHHKTSQWYFYAAITGGIAALLALLTGNWTMALAIVTFAAVYQYVQKHHPPKDIGIVITELGIHVGEMFFPYSNIIVFWIIYKKGNKTLNLRVANRFYSDVIIQLDGQDPADVRNYLIGKVPEWEGKDERFIDYLIRIFKL